MKVTQMVHLLPYERYDLYKEAVNRLTAMADCLLDHSLCKTFLSCYQDCSDPAQGEVDQAEINFRVPTGKYINTPFKNKQIP